MEDNLLPEELIYVIKFLYNYINGGLWALMLKKYGMPCDIQILITKNIIESFDLLKKSVDTAKEIINEYTKYWEMGGRGPISFHLSKKYSDSIFGFYNIKEIHECEKDIFEILIYKDGTCVLHPIEDEEIEDMQDLDDEYEINIKEKISSNTLRECTIKFLYYAHNFPISFDAKNLITYSAYYRAFS